MNKRCCINKVLLLILLCFVFLNNNCVRNKMFLVNKPIELSGKIEHKYFDNVMSNGDHMIGNSDRIEYIILELDQPIDVAKEPVIGGPEYNVKVLQIAPYNKKILNDITDNINKRVLLKGSLFYATTVYHFEKVLFYCRDIKIK